MGIQGAGKSQLVEEYTDRGYLRLNRDVLGGRLTDLIPRLIEALDEGEQRIVLDNTYPTQTSRAPVIHVANYFGLPVRCRYLATSPADARFNIAARILKRYGKLLGPDEMKEMAEQDSNLPPPVALQRWIESFEPPTTKEGFATVEQIPFTRMRDPTWKEKGLLLDVDGTLRKTVSGELYPRSADDVELLPHRREVLLKWMEDGYKLFFVSNQSGVASGKVAAAEVEAAFQRTIDLLGLPVTEVAYCPHPAFPAGCFCRKPMPGLGVYLMMKHHLSFDALVMVGDMDSDREFAQSLGARYFEASEFFEIR